MRDDSAAVSVGGRPGPRLGFAFARCLPTTTSDVPPGLISADAELTQPVAHGPLGHVQHGGHGLHGPPPPQHVDELQAALQVPDDALEMDAAEIVRCHQVALALKGRNGSHGVL